MLTNIAKKIFGSRNDRLLKQYRKSVAKINALEKQMQALSDAELQAKTAEFKQRLADGQSLDDILVEAFAVCREASSRVLGMRHFDVQLIGGMVLHKGNIAEMRTGEGKTLVATLAVYLNALSGKGVHVVTVNDYLASRDASIMEPLYNFLGLSVGVIVADLQPFERQTAYGADITYGTNNEFGFDYLRDNMVTDQYDKVQRELNFAVVDEVDSILIDEARTPLIISGQADDNIQLYRVMNAVPAHLIRQETEEGEGDYWVDEKAHQVILSEAGHEHAEQIQTQMGLLQENDSLYSAANIALMHQVVTAQLAAARQGTHATKTRGDVRGGGRTPYRQKGTGRARQGSTRAPQFAGGGVVHGPPPRDYTQRTPKKMKAAALRSALSDRARNGRVHVITEFLVADRPSTKQALAGLRNLTDRKALVVVNREDVLSILSLRNLPDVHVTWADQLNTYDVLNNDDVIFTADALDRFLGRGEEESK